MLEIIKAGRDFIFIWPAVLFLALNPAQANEPPMEAATINNNQSFDWYRTQYNTGPISRDNCGPTCLSMAMMYQDGNPDKAPSPSAIREWRPHSVQDGGVWYWNVDMPEVLDHYGYRWSQVMLGGKSRSEVETAVRQNLKEGNVLIFCFSVTAISMTNNPKATRYNRFYSGTFGHFVVVKGYLDNENWLIVYDPWVMTNDSYYEGNYPDGKPMGRERYYNFNELVSSLIEWNKNDKKYAFTVVPGNPDQPPVLSLNRESKGEFSHSPSLQLLGISTLSGQFAGRTFDIRGRRLEIRSHTARRQ